MHRRYDEVHHLQEPIRSRLLPPGQEEAVRLLPDKLKEYELNFDFRKRWKRIASVEMSRDVAIFQYNDGTKLYLEVG